MRGESYNSLKAKTGKKLKKIDTTPIVSKKWKKT
jgi:hypothetical protein